MPLFGSNAQDEQKIREAAQGYNSNSQLPNSQSTSSFAQSSSYETASEHESVANEETRNLQIGSTPKQQQQQQQNETLADDANSAATVTNDNTNKTALPAGAGAAAAVSPLNTGKAHDFNSDVSNENAEVPYRGTSSSSSNKAEDEDEDENRPQLDVFDGALNRTISSASRARTLERRLTEAREGKEVDESDEGIPVDKLTWDSPNDPGNPQNWPVWKKWFITMTTACIALVVTFGSSLYTSGVADIVQRGMASQELAIAGLTFYVLGLAFGPMIAAPLSELYGRRVAYLASFPASLIFTLGVGFSNKIREILVLRFFAGVLGSPALAVCSGTISDMWSLDNIEVAMSFFCLAPFAGPVIGPVIGGYAVEHFSWRWTMWIDLFFGAAVLPFLLLCPETYKPVILKRRAQKRGIKVAKPNISTKEYLTQVVNIYVAKPSAMLVVEPIVLVFSIWSAFIFAVLFGFFEAYPVIFRGVYKFNLGNSGLPFLGIGLGLVFGTILYLWLVSHVFWKKNPDGSSPLFKNGVFTPPQPETRLLPAKIGAIFLPIGLFWVGWSGKSDNVHWIVPIIGGVPFGFGLILIFFSTITYFSLSYPPISVASAIAANNFLRYVLACVFPLFTIQMFTNVHIGWAASIFAFISLVMVPIPWIFEKWGPQLRQKSRYSYAAVFKAQKAQEAKLKQEEEELRNLRSHQSHAADANEKV